MGGYTHLDAESSVDLRLTLVVLPDNAELDDALGDLHNVERLLVFCSIDVRSGGHTIGDLRPHAPGFAFKKGPRLSVSSVSACSNSGSEGRTIVVR